MGTANQFRSPGGGRKSRTEDAKLEAVPIFQVTARGQVTQEGRLLALEDEGARFMVRPFDVDQHGAIPRQDCSFPGWSRRIGWWSPSGRHDPTWSWS